MPLSLRFFFRKRIRVHYIEKKANTGTHHANANTKHLEKPGNLNFYRDNPGQKKNRKSPSRSLSTPTPPLAASAGHLHIATERTEPPANPSSGKVPRSPAVLWCPTEARRDRQGASSLRSTGGGSPHNFAEPGVTTSCRSRRKTTNEAVAPPSATQQPSQRQPELTGNTV